MTTVYQVFGTGYTNHMSQETEEVNDEDIYEHNGVIAVECWYHGDDPNTPYIHVYALSEVIALRVYYAAHQTFKQNLFDTSITETYCPLEIKDEGFDVHTDHHDYVSQALKNPHG